MAKEHTNADNNENWRTIVNPTEWLLWHWQVGPLQ